MAKTYDIRFATMSLGGFNGTKAGARCKTVQELMDGWWMFQLKKGRKYDLSDEEWDALIIQAGNIMDTRKEGPPPGVHSQYWDIVQGKDGKIPLV